MANIVSNEETEVMPSEPKLSYDDLQETYDELLDDSQILSSHYASLKKNFQKLSLDFKNTTTFLSYGNTKLCNALKTVV